MCVRVCVLELDILSLLDVHDGAWHSHALNLVGLNWIISKSIPLTVNKNVMAVPGRFTGHFIMFSFIASDVFFNGILLKRKYRVLCVLWYAGWHADEKEDTKFRKLKKGKRTEWGVGYVLLKWYCFIYCCPWLIFLRSRIFFIELEELRLMEQRIQFLFFLFFKVRSGSDHLKTIWQILKQNIWEFKF